MSLEKLMSLMSVQHPEIQPKDIKFEYLQYQKKRYDMMTQKADDFFATQDSQKKTAENYAFKMMVEKYKLGKYEDLINDSK